MIGYGNTNSGYQRFKCKDCNYIYTFHNHQNKVIKERKVFEWWITEGYSVRQLIKISKHGIWKIKQVKSYWLNICPPKIDYDYATIKYLLFDGTYFKHENCLMVVINNVNNQVIAHDYNIKENYAAAVKIFQSLQVVGTKPIAITIDGNTSVIRALKTVWPEIVIQRCLTHIQRQGLSWLRRFPKSTAAKELRYLLIQVAAIKNYKQQQNFVKQFAEWEKQYGKFVASLPSTDKVFSDLQRTRSLIIHALPNMFHYLNDQKIVSTTNKIEGYFSRLKSSYKLHRGLSKKHRLNYFNWYIYFKNIN